MLSLQTLRFMNGYDFLKIHYVQRTMLYIELLYVNWHLYYTFDTFLNKSLI